MKAVILEERRKVAGALFIVREVLEEVADLPGLIERHGDAQIAPGNFLPDQAQGQHIGPGAPHLLGQGEGPEPHAAPFFHHIPGKPLGGVFDPLALARDGANLALGEFMGQALERRLFFGELKIHEYSFFDTRPRGGAPLSPPPGGSAAPGGRETAENVR